MPSIDTGRFEHAAGARRGATRRLVGCVVAATLAAATTGTAQAVVPRVGAWESGGLSAPRVSFDVQGPARARTVRRVSYPITCQGSPSPIGWGATSFVRVRAGGRFTAYGINSVIRGRFTAKRRATVVVHASGTGDCEDTRRYAVLRRGRRVPVRPGRYVTFVGAAAGMGLEADAFAHMVRVEYTEGSLPSICSDGSQRPLTLAGPQDVVLAAPIRSDGRFDISAAAGSSITIAGTFDRASVGAAVDLSAVLPDGTRCTAPRQSLVGSLAFPEESESGQYANFPAPPVIIQPPG